jgi:hypothetical protein
MQIYKRLEPRKYFQGSNLFYFYNMYFYIILFRNLSTTFTKFCSNLLF